MILVDTSVWVQHLRHGNTRLADLLEDEQVLSHPFVIGELAMGSIKNRLELLTLLERLPASAITTHRDVLTLVDRRRLHGSGIGWIDAHLLASAMLSQSRIWTLDGPLERAARSLDVDARI